jgi:hypothetical protein
MHIDDTAAAIELPMERPLHTPAIKPVIADMTLDADNAQVDTGALFSQVIIDKAALSQHIGQALQERSQISLRQLCEARPLQHRLAELVAYLQLAGEPAGASFKAAIDENAMEASTGKVPMNMATCDSGRHGCGV